MDSFERLYCYSQNEKYQLLSSCLYYIKCIALPPLQYLILSMHLLQDVLFSLGVKRLYINTLATKHACASNCGLGTSDQQGC